MKRSDLAVLVGLDTSVLVRLLVGEPADQTVLACEFMAGLEERGGRALVSNLVVAETYFACQHHYGVPKAKVLSALHDLLAKPTFLLHSALPDLLQREALATGRPGFIDRLIHAEYTAQGIPLATFEKAAARLEGAIVLEGG